MAGSSASSRLIIGKVGVLALGLVSQIVVSILNGL
jgi:hypothetical protein